MDNLDDFMMSRPPTPNRPLLGLTVLVVEDSRFACEAMRLLCLRSGARIRRADSLFSARRHLSTYRPSVVIVDLGLPDGSGSDLIRDLTTASSRVDVILGTSGDPDAEARATAAGADGFIAKPVANLAQFQGAILRHLPADRQPSGPRAVTDEVVAPDLVAFRDDLAHVANVLSGEEEAEAIDYVTQFLGGVARSAKDHDLDAAVTALASCRIAGGPVRSEIARLAAMVHARLTPVGPI
jgi:DNA-binding response OmpR family regulator